MEQQTIGPTKIELLETQNYDCIVFIIKLQRDKKVDAIIFIAKVFD